MANGPSDIVKDFFRWIPPKFSAEAVTSKLFHDTAGSDLSNRYPVDNAYCSRFCRFLLDILEKDEGLDTCNDREELIENLYNKMGNLFSSGTPCDSYRTYFLSSEHPELSVSMRETRAMISDGTTGLTSWTAGECLSAWLDSHSDLLRGRSVLELGAGSGITGVFALKRLPDISHYTFTDCHLKVLDNLRLNVTNNLLDSGEMMRDDTECLEMRTGDHTRVMVTHLDWVTFSERPEDKDVTAEVILGADIVFDPDLIPSLVTTIRILLARSDQGLAVIACCVRNQDTFDIFEKSLSDQGLKFTKDLLHDITPPVFLLQIESR